MFDLATFDLYRETRSEEAFGRVVAEYRGRIYASCLRRLDGNHADAEDACQAVFVILAEKAGGMRIRSSEQLLGWLFRTAGFVVSHIRRAAARRNRRETAASVRDDTARRATVPEIELSRKHLDCLIDKLPSKFRDPLLGHFFLGKTFSELANAAGCGESTIRMRVNAGIEKLRGGFVRQGIDLSAGTISTCVLVGVTGATSSAGAGIIAAANVVVSETARHFAKGALRMMFWNQAKAALIAASIAISVGGGGALAVQKMVSRDAGEQPQAVPVPAEAKTVALKLDGLTRLEGDTLAGVRTAIDGHRGVSVWGADYLNRRNFNGVIYYVNHSAAEPQRALIWFNSIGDGFSDGSSRGGDFGDGQPQNLSLRIFDPRDRCVFASEIGQTVPGWYSCFVDLRGQPDGRYRFSFQGWNEGLALATDPPSAVGVIGARTAGIEGPRDVYVYVPAGVKSWKIRAHASGQGAEHAVAVLDEKGETVAEQKLPRPKGVVDFHDIVLAAASQDAVMQIRFLNENRYKIILDGIPGIMWPTADAARRNRGDMDVEAGRVISHEWQRPLARWLASRKTADFEIRAGWRSDVDFNRVTDHQIFALAPLSGKDGLFGVGRTLITRNQIVDPSSPDLGLFAENPAGYDRLAPNPYHPDLDSNHYLYRYGQLGYVATIAALMADHAGGYNPYYNDPGLVNRVTAGTFQLLLCVPEEQVVPYDSFMELRAMGKIAAMLHPRLDRELAEAFRAGLIEHGGRDGFWDGYVSNQALAVVTGLKHLADVTGDEMMKRYFERYIAAFMAGQMRNPNLGQAPSGIYQEVGGFDGAYNTYSASTLMQFWHMTNDPRYFSSLEKYFELTRHLTVRLPDGRFTSARNWNTRTNTLTHRWHPFRSGVCIPGASLFWRDDGSGRPEDCLDVEKMRALLKRTWNETAGPEMPANGVNKWWRGWINPSPPYAAPCKLGCEEPGPYFRAFGNDFDRNFAVARFGPWYAVFFGGDTFNNGRAGSGLATLWHEDLGPLVVGETRISQDWVQTWEAEKTADELSLTFAEGWVQNDGKRAFTDRSKHAFRAREDENSVSVATVTRPDSKAWELRRSYTMTAGEFSSTAVTEAVGFREHDVYFPLAAGPHVRLEAVDPDGNPLDLKIGQEAAISGWRWTPTTDDRPPAKRARLVLKQTVRAVYLGENRPQGGLRSNMAVRFYRASFGATAGEWKILIEQ